MGNSCSFITNEKSGQRKGGYEGSDETLQEKEHAAHEFLNATGNHQNTTNPQWRSCKIRPNYYSGESIMRIKCHYKDLPPWQKVYRDLQKRRRTKCTLTLQLKMGDRLEEEPGMGGHKMTVCHLEPTHECQ